MGKRIEYIVASILLILVVVTWVTLSGSNIKFVSLKPELKWEQNKQEVRELGELYEMSLAGVSKIVVVLQNKLEVIPAGAVGRSLSELVLYSKVTRIGSILIVNVYVDEDQYSQTEPELRDRLTRQAVGLRLGEELWIPAENEERVKELIYNDTFWLEGRI